MVLFSVTHTSWDAVNSAGPQKVVDTIFQGAFAPYRAKLPDIQAVRISALKEDIQRVVSLLAAIPGSPSIKTKEWPVSKSQSITLSPQLASFAADIMSLVKFLAACVADMAKTAPVGADPKSFLIEGGNRMCRKMREIEEITDTVLTSLSASGSKISLSKPTVMLLSNVQPHIKEWVQGLAIDAIPLVDIKAVWAKEHAELDGFIKTQMDAPSGSRPAWDDIKNFRHRPVSRSCACARMY